MRIVISLQVSTNTTITGNSNNNDDACINKIHEYCNEGERVDISDEDATE